MPRFLRIENDNPIPEFFATIRRLRAPIERAYLEAFSASDACNDGVVVAKERLRAALYPTDDGVPLQEAPGTRLVDEVDKLYRAAYVDDLNCDLQASLVVLFADNAIQRLAKLLLKRSIGLDGFGPKYNNGVRLTTLLRATTNTLRHVDDWADLPFPYPEPLSVLKKKRGPLENIEVLQKVFGIGKHERLRDWVSWRAVALIDGLYGTHPPAYRRFETALISAAADICSAGEPSFSAEFDRERSRDQSPE